MFKSKSVSFSVFKTLPLQNRMKLARSPNVGSSLLSALTPTEYAELFPKYYQRLLPDVQGFQLAVTKRSRQQQDTENNALLERLGAVEGSNRELRQGMEKAGINVPSSKVAEPKLSPEQLAAYEALKSGDILASSEQGKIFSELTRDELGSVGINKIKNEKGEDVYHYTPSVVSRQEAESRLKTPISSDSWNQKAPNVMARLQSDLNITKEQAAGIVGSLKPESGLRAIKEERPLSGRGGFGWAQWTGPRRIKFEQFAAARGLSVTDDEANYQFLIHELKTSQASELARLKTARTAAEAAHIFTGSNRERVGFLRPGVEHYGASERAAEAAMSLVGGGQKPQGPGGQYSDKQIADITEQIRREKDATMKIQLARLLNPNIPDPGSPAAQKMFGNQSTELVANRINKLTGQVIGSGQCVDLARQFVGSNLHVGDWRRGQSVLSGNLVPGTPIATFMDRNHNPSNLYDGGQGHGISGNQSTHAAIFEGYIRDANNKIIGIKVLEQWSGQPAKHSTYSVNDLKTTKNAANYYVVNDTKGNVIGNGSISYAKEQVQNTITEATPKKDVPKIIPQEQRPAEPTAVKQPSLSQTTPAPVNPATQGSTSKSNTAEQTTAAKQPEQPTAAVEKKPDQLQQTTKKEPETAKIDKKPESTISSFSVNRDAFKEMATKENALAAFAGHETIRTGFNDDPRVRAAGAHIDDKWILHVKDMNNPQVKEVMSGIKGTNVLTPLKGAARGGKFTVPDGGLTAYRALEGKDNTLVLDKNQKPLFTMNDQEAATFDPSQNKVSVSPTLKAKGDMRGQRQNQQAASQDNTDIVNSIDSLRQEMSSKFNQNQLNTRPVNLKSAQSETFSSMIGELHDMTKTPFHNPAMERAVSRIGGVETSGSPGIGMKHFNFGNKNG